MNSARPLRVCASLAVALALVAACKGPPTGTEEPVSVQDAAPVVAEQAATPAPAAPATAAPPDKAAAAGKVAGPAPAAGLAGVWTVAGGACDSGTAFTLLPDGRYQGEGEAGAWRREGAELIVTIEPSEAPSEQAEAGDAAATAALTVLSVTADTAELRREGGEVERWTRCGPP
jgi:hypothetical protein